MLKLLLTIGIILQVFSRPPGRIAFGSCNKFYESHKMDIFQKIIAQKPSHMFFLGDFVYLDKFIYPNLPTVWYSEED
jgi:phosphodiesterase/alkaline phosphatase D-like protein